VLVVALLAHAELIALLPHARRAVSHESPSAPDDPVWIEESKTITERTTDTSNGAIGMVTPHRGGFTISVRPSGSGGDTTNPETVTTAPTESESGALSSLLVNQDIGLSGNGSYRMEVAKQQPTAQQIANENANRAIMDPIHAHEIQNGDLTSGPVVAELERTTRSLAGTPMEGHAIFAVRVDEVGLVMSVGVDESSGDATAWSEVATRVLNALAQKRLHMPNGAKGVAMRIEVSSKVALPSGARSPLHVGSPALDALSNMTKGQFDKAPDNGMGSVPIVGGTFDLSDIGARPTRQVAAHVVTESIY